MLRAHLISKGTAWRAPPKVNSLKDESCIASVYYCFHTYPYRNLQQIAIIIFSLICLHFGKLQSNTFNERIPKYRRIRKRTQLPVGPQNDREHNRDRVVHYTDTHAFNIRAW